MPDIKLETGLDKVIKEIENHRVFDCDYFKRLNEMGWNRETYNLHRANFFYRTELTVKAIAHVCARAAIEDDVPTLTLFSYILNEECGNGKLENCHALLMDKSHNLFGQVAFGLTPIAVTAAKNSPLIIEGTRQYRQRMAELAGGSYQCLLGITMALETHAEKMLTHCRTAFRAHQEKFAERKVFVHDVEVYFNMHLNSGVEERHAADAKACVMRNCRSAEDLAEIARGARETLEIQLTMWKDMERWAASLTESNLEETVCQSEIA